ncbi:MAG: aminotransferase class I/II-fold pyridoxal phosphate-dependent enzyme [Defluviitaleaceae bacterium]|nr:aminotransferase class I/II-fold pyridoxal phosphate-dependent enzyme [Defluviitaleaceae bacterium]
MKTLCDKFLSAKVRRLSPYVAGLQPREDGWIKLNTNENPYPPSPRVGEVLHKIDTSRLRLYPDAESGDLKRAIAAAGELFEAGLCEENLFCANSADDVLALAYMAFFSGKDKILTPDISYGFYPVWGEMHDAGMEFVPIGADFSIDAGAYKNGNGVVIANPNAPTSLALPLADIERILQQNPDGVVIIDETYIAFAREGSAVALVGRYKNLLITRTFSKSHGLAGLRVGYAIGQPHLIDGLRRARDAFNSYPLDLLAQTCAAAAVSDRDYFIETTGKIIATRERVIAELRKMGCRVISSQANFIFMESSDASALYDFLCENKILTRHWNKPPGLENFLRVSIGTDDEMEGFLQCVNRFLNGEPTKPL